MGSTTAILCPKCVDVFYGTEVSTIKSVAEFNDQTVGTFNVSVNSTKIWIVKIVGIFKNVTHNTFSA